MVSRILSLKWNIVDPRDPVSTRVISNSSGPDFVTKSLSRRVTLVYLFEFFMTTD